MNMTDKEVMQMALDALIETVHLAGEYGTHLIRSDKDKGHAYKTIETLRAVLVQPEKTSRTTNPEDIKKIERKWQGLTEADKKGIFNACEPDERSYVIAMTEALLKDKNK